MPGTNYIGSAQQQLGQLLQSPIPGQNSSGFDALSGGYAAGESSGTSDIARRGITQSGAPAELATNLGEQYAQGAGQVVAAGQNQQNQRMLQLLNSLLGLGGAAEGQYGADIGTQQQEAGAAGGVAGGLFGRPISSNPFLANAPSYPGGLFSTGLFNNPSFFSQITKALGFP